MIIHSRHADGTGKGNAADTMTVFLLHPCSQSGAFWFALHILPDPFVTYYVGFSKLTLVCLPLPIGDAIQIPLMTRTT